MNKKVAMIKVYDLRDNEKYISYIQKASVESEAYGYRADHGLFGSAEWWAAIDSGAIETHVLEGVISRLFRTGHNDYPQVEVTSQSGTTTWEQLGDERYYEVGRPIRITYVKQRPKRPFGGRTHIEEALRVEIDANAGEDP